MGRRIVFLVSFLQYSSMLAFNSSTPFMLRYTFTSILMFIYCPLSACHKLNSNSIIIEMQFSYSSSIRIKKATNRRATEDLILSFLIDVITYDVADNDGQMHYVEAYEPKNIMSAPNISKFKSTSKCVRKRMVNQLM